MMGLQERRLTLEELVSVVDEVEPYVLTLEDAEASLDGAKEAKVLVVMKRPAGVLLAVPVGFIADELLEQGNGGADGLFGPSVNITVPGVVLDNGVVSPTGTMVNAVLVDCSAQILEFLRLPSMFEEIASTFDADDPFALPAGDASVAAALEWIPQVVGLTEFYTAESSAPKTPVAKRKASRPGGERATPSGAPGATKQKRPTTASLAENIEVLMQTIPGLNFQMQELVERQNMMEQRLALPTSGHRGTLSQPLGASFEGRLASLGSLAATAKAPPKTADRQQLGLLASAFLWHDFDTSAAKVPNFDAEVLEENLKLARLWDSRGLLRIFDRPLRPGFFSRVFNAYKSPEKDRQIGDRRLPNCEERHIDGPSAFLPQGQLLCNIRLPRFRVGLRGSITDRRDFYHQAEVSMARAQSNLLPFEFPRSYFPDFDFDSNFPVKRKKADRSSGGDGFGDRFYGGHYPQPVMDAMWALDLFTKEITWG